MLNDILNEFVPNDKIEELMIYLHPYNDYYVAEKEDKQRNPIPKINSDFIEDVEYKLLYLWFIKKHLGDKITDEVINAYKNPPTIKELREFYFKSVR